jgi:hypothetical protein
MLPDAIDVFTVFFLSFCAIALFPLPTLSFSIFLLTAFD